jgi:hypothetical protein
LKQVNDSAKSRGELRLEKSEEISNTVLENSKSENDAIPTYAVENSELDDLLNDATATKAEAEQQEKTEQTHGGAQNSSKITAEKAMKIAVTGLNQIVGIASELTGKNIVLGELPTTLFAMLTAPVIQKYQPKFDLDPEGVDLDSWIPEVMALGGVCTAALPIYLQVNNDEIKTEGGPKNGDKSEHGA